MTISSPWFLLALLIVPATLAGRCGSSAGARGTPWRSPTSTCSPPSSSSGARGAAGSRSRCSCSRSDGGARSPGARDALGSRRAARRFVLLVDVSGSMRAGGRQADPARRAQNANGASPIGAEGVKSGSSRSATGPNLLVIRRPTGRCSTRGSTCCRRRPVPDRRRLELAVQTVKQAVGDAPRSRDGKIPGAIVLLSTAPDARHADAAAGRRQSARRGHPCLHDRARHGSRLARFNGSVSAVGAVAAIAAEGTGGSSAASRSAQPGDAGGDRPRDRRQDLRAQSASKVQGIYKQHRREHRARPSTREVSSWFTGAAALLLLLSLGSARGHRRAAA